MVEELIARPAARSPRRAAPGRSSPRLLREVSTDRASRWLTRIKEFDLVSGGGVVPGSLLLIGGDPGIGKSTLVLEVADALSRDAIRVLYVSGEESEEQVRLRADRLGVGRGEFYLLGETNLEVILEQAARLSPGLLVVDSVQTVYLEGLQSAPGSVAQVRECGSLLLRQAKENGRATFLVGHVTKDGSIAGPRTLEHLVDTVLYFEGERHQAFRILRAVKNRFGSTNEIGVFEMTPEGLREVGNPSEVFLSERRRATPGSVVTSAMEGTRPLLIEVQALLAPSSYGVPQRVATGLDPRRLSMLLAVLEKRGGLHVGTQDVFVNLAGGLRVDEPALDLALVCAIASAFKGRPCDPSTVVIGEVGLGGEVRSVSQIQKRLQEAGKLGFSRCLIPSNSAKGVKTAVELIGVGDVGEALDQILIRKEQPAKSSPR
jgi:DNA repair protein RadA/Sms